MSREAWGDEGGGAQNWDETAIRQDFDAVRKEFEKWWRDHKSDAPGPDFEALVEDIWDSFDELSEQMTGQI